MAIPLKWNTLEQAAKWLSDKTNDEWTAKKIIEFSIDRCRPDDIVEDYKYPTYLRALIPETMVSLLTFVALRKDTYSSVSDIDYVCEDVSFGGKKASITFLFKENLIALKEGGESTLLYVSSNDYNLIRSDAAPVTIYCELQPLVWCIDDPSIFPRFPKLPVIEINYESVGIRDEELRQLLRDYLSSPKQVPGKSKKPRKNQIDKIECQKIMERLWEENPNLTIAYVANHPEVSYYKKIYTGKNTLRNWAREVDPRDGDKRGRPRESTLKTYAN